MPRQLLWQSTVSNRTWMGNHTTRRRHAPCSTAGVHALPVDADILDAAVVDAAAAGYGIALEAVPRKVRRETGFAARKRQP